MTTLEADRLKTLTMSFGVLMIALGLVAIFLFSAQILVPAQPATPGHWEGKVIDGVTRNVWYAGQPSQPEHFETSYPNLPTGLGLILAGIAIPAVGVFYQKRAR